jgi:hypothetical protein
VDYNKETWNFGKDDGDYEEAENTIAWSNGIHVRWTGKDNILYLLNTNYKKNPRVSYIVFLRSPK